MGLTSTQIKRELARLQREINCVGCRECIELTGCETGQVPTWDEDLQGWVCEDAGGGHDPLTLNADQPTQDAANLVGQELQLVPAGTSTYGVVKLEDLFAQFQRVDTYDDLPDPTLNADEYYHVENSQGTKWLPGSLGGTYYSKGFYYSDGVSWVFVGEVPYQALQADVDAGIITDQFVSPATLNSATTVSHPGHTHVTADVTDHTEVTQDLVGAMVSGNTESGIAVTYDDTNGKLDFAVSGAGIDHGLLTGLGDDDHTIYALLAGRATGQTINGGNAANEDLILEGTSHVTKTTSYVLLQPSGGFVGIGTSAPAAPLEITGTDAAGVTENIRLNSSLAGSTRDIRVSGTTGGLRFLSTETALSVQPNGASFQMWSNGSGLPGQLYFDSGSHNSAAIVFRTAPTTTNIAERLRITSAGRIGIGTSAPDKILEVNLGTADAFRLTYNDSNGGATTYCDTTISSVGLVTFDAVGSAPKFNFSDNVGIGNASPASLLDVGTYNIAFYTIRSGSFVLQPYAHNNGFIADNAYYNAGWQRLSAGYTAGFQFYNGQLIVFGANTGSGTFTMTPILKTDYANSGTVGLGGNMSINSNDYTGSSMVVLGTGKVGIGQNVPTAILHIKAGTATANTAPLKFTSGTNLTTAEAGAFEYNGTNLFFTRTGTTRQTVLTANVVTTEVVTSDTTVTININGTDYKLLAKA